MLINNLRELDKMAFTANEMVTAIANRPGITADLVNRFERAGFASYLEEAYGADDQTAAELLEDLVSTGTLYEGDQITNWRRDLISYREELAPRGLGGTEG